MKLSRKTIKEIMNEWGKSWNNHDLDEIMELFHDDIVFENWTESKVQGKETLRKAWTPWLENHGDFQFITEDFIVDEEEQKVIWEWYLEWPSLEKGFEGKPERRHGADIIYLKDGKVIKKCTFSKTTLEIDGKRVKLAVMES